MKAPDCGLHYDIPHDIYRSWDAVSNSALGAFAISPAHYKWPTPKESKAFNTGSLIHGVVLENTLDSYAVVPPFHEDPENRTAKGEVPSNPKATGYYKHKVEIFAEAHSDQAIISQESYDMCSGVLEAVRAHPRASELLTGGKPEVSMVWRSDELLLLKGRVDYLRDDLFVDLKTTKSCTSFNVGTYHYHRQMAIYLEGIKACTGKTLTPWIIALETESPYGIMCAPLSLDALAVGLDEAHTLLEDLAQCQFADSWPGYEDPVEWELPQ